MFTIGLRPPHGSRWEAFLIGSPWSLITSTTSCPRCVDTILSGFNEVYEADANDSRYIPFCVFLASSMKSIKPDYAFCFLCIAFSACDELPCIRLVERQTCFIKRLTWLSGTKRIVPLIRRMNFQTWNK